MEYFRRSGFSDADTYMCAVLCRYGGAPVHYQIEKIVSGNKKLAATTTTTTAASQY